MLKTTFELTLVSRRCDASDRMRAFIFQNLTDFKRGRMHDTGKLISQIYRQIFTTIQKSFYHQKTAH